MTHRRYGPAATVVGPPVAYLHEALMYDPETGAVFWKKRPLSHFKASARRTAAHVRALWNAKHAGKPAAHLMPKTGRFHLFLDRRQYLAHRVIWAMQTGTWPAGEIDHINGSGSDNRWVNLRLVTRVENTRNAARRKDNTSGATGVYAVGRRWRAVINRDGKSFVLGTFTSFETAVGARKAAERMVGYHPNHGRAP